MLLETKASSNNTVALKNKRKGGAGGSAKESSYRPYTFLQCHSREDEGDDFTQQVWCCRFHPNLRNMVATCGGQNVCLIDCSTAKVKARFAQANEEFYTLDWTTIRMNHLPANVIACGGCLGFIYLIHTDQFLAYGYFKAHSKPVQNLAFLPHIPTFLLSAGNEKKVYLWDIGIPSLPDYHYAHKKLAVFENLMYSPLKLLSLKDAEHILCASEGGLFCWSVSGVLENKKNSKFHRYSDVTEIQFPFVEDPPIVDGLTVVSEDILATKCAGSGVIFIWKTEETLSKCKKGVKKVTASVLCELKWSNTEQYYINISCCPKNDILVAGDDTGSIWLYNLEDIKAPSLKKQKSLLPRKIAPPSEIIPWPVCKRENGIKIPDLQKGMVFNDVCISDGSQYIVVVADNNIVGIYKATCE